MRISQFSIHRPKLTTMVALIVVVMGVISLRRLPIDLMPDISYPTLSISASYENASPEEVEELVARPIEEAMSAVPGVEEVSSESSEGKSSVRVAFSWDTDLDAAANDVRDRLDRVISQLPEDMDRPSLMKFDPSSMPILIMGASSNLGSIQMRKVIDEQIKYRIERVPGVAALDVMGGQEREIQVNLYIDKIQALGIPLDQILTAIGASNVTQPAGTVERGHYEVIIRTPGEYANLAELRDTVVATLDEAPVRLKDIASVEDTSQKLTRIVRVNGRPGVHLSVTKQSGKNTVEVAESVLEEVGRINRDIKQVQLIPIIDSSDYINRSISSVGSAAMYGGGFAVLVLLFFLRNIRSTVIIAVAIPLSIIAAFALMYFAGFTLNIMTMGGLALGIGMLVDNAIVVLENTYRLRDEEGLNAEQAALKGAEEVTGAVIASTLTTVAVFLPLLFVQGMAGVMFKQLALVVSFSLISSLVVSLTVVPMLAAKYLHVASPVDVAGEVLAHKAFRVSGRMFAELENAYKRILHWALSHRAGVLIGAAVLLVGSLPLASLVGVELMPQSDEGEVRVEGEMEVGTKLSMLDEKFQAIESVLARGVPEMKSSVANVGGGMGPMSAAGHTGQIRMALKPQAERTRSSEQAASDLRQKLSGIPGMTVRTRAGTGMFTMMLRGPGGGTERVQVEIRGYDLDTADTLAQHVKDAVGSVEGITDAQVSRESGSPEELVIVDRPRAADMKLTVSSISGMLRTALGGTTASNYREGGDEYEILVQLENADKMDLDDILNLTLTNAVGEPVMLRNVVDVRSHSGPVSIERKDQERIVTVSANVTGRDVGSILKDIQSKLQSIPVPNGFTIGFAGEYEQQQETFGELAVVLVMALALVYMVMVSLYESLRDPFVVMFSAPPAVIGVLWMLFLTDTTLNMQSLIGCIMLAGIVVNNAIVLVDQTNLLRRRDGMPLR
ncbi:MAG: efflux RND transporter permease subunit, partial [Candidatus Eisenbacteria bacterium]|nr:efflux RND transporter permease subunit [Candidatus Eisenbacteria bacterium]